MDHDDTNFDAIFCGAIEIAAAEERAAFIARSCGPDEELRLKVESLVAAHCQAGSFLEVPPGSPTLSMAPAPRAEGAGAAVGPYKLLQQIGEGGMGTVYMAEQGQPVRRKVALKVIKAGMDSRQVIARFEAERQALTMMDHVNIARVLDAGTTDAGLPYFVMELVHGVPITQYCDDNRLTPRQRLELFVPVCRAIQHAHQKGIIHRDIKPSNVMITLYDGQPVPKVIDFGVAKATEQRLTERTLFTQYGTLVGTLEYMSPEQAEMSALGVDTRSDIFSLGVLLYELLTGSTPLSHKRVREAVYAEVLRMIREEEPPRPSTRLGDSGEPLASISAQRHMEPARLTKLVRGELDWIVMKSLEKDRNRRYETASGFAADVRRYLDDEPVQACPPSARYRLRKFARRNKVALTTLIVVLMSVLVASATIGWALRDRRAREAELGQRAARELALTEQGIRQALDRGAESSADLHAILRKPGGVQQQLNQPARWELSLATARGELAQARQLASRAAGRLDAGYARDMDRLERQLASDRADYDLARRLETIRLDTATFSGTGGNNTKANVQALEVYPEALAGLDLLGDDPASGAARIASSPIRDQLVAALDHWATLAYLRRMPKLSGQLQEVARRAVPDPAWGDRLRRVEIWGDREALRKLVARAPIAGLSPQVFGLLGSRLSDDDPLKATWLRRGQFEHPADYWSNFDLAWLLRKSDPAEAVAFYRVAIAVRPGNAGTYTNLGVALRRQNRLPEAIACYRKAIELDPKHAFAHVNLGWAHYAQRRLPEAIACYHKAIELDPKHPFAHNNLGIVLDEQGKLEDAIASYRRAIELDPKYAHAYNNLGVTFQKQGKSEDAIACFRRAIELDPNYSEAYDNLGGVFGQKGWELANCPDPKLRDPRRAVEAGTEAVECAPQSSIAWQYLGWVQYRAGNWTASLEALEKSCKLQAGGTGDYGQWIVMSLAHARLANENDLTEEERGRHKTEARRWYDQAVKDFPRGAVGEDSMAQAIRAFRVEAAELLGVEQEEE
jgi:serine/threonine protein kinase/tetratricopeptide (TPR) repeat protein